MVSRERDSYYEELVTQVQQSSLIPFHPTAVAVSTPAPAYTAPAPSSVLATATLPTTTNPPVQYAPASSALATHPVQQQQQQESMGTGGAMAEQQPALLPHHHPSTIPHLQQQQTQPARNPLTGLSAYGADPPTPFLQGMLSAMSPSPLSVPPPQQAQAGIPLQTPGLGLGQVPVTPASGSGDPWWARAATSPSAVGPSASAVPPGLGCTHVSTPSIGCNMASASVVQPNPIACPGVGPPLYPPGGGYPAPPSVPPTAHPSQGATPHGASPADEFGGRVKATPAKLPRLEMKATDASKITLQIQN
eukprot:758850-Amphidinium_carterae.1